MTPRVRAIALFLGIGIVLLLISGYVLMRVPTSPQPAAVALPLLTSERMNDGAIESTFSIDTVAAPTKPTDGIFLMSRASKDGTTGYYAGMQVDGSLVIERRTPTTYERLAHAPFFQGAYDSTERPNLLPQHELIALRSETRTTAEGVHLDLFLKQAGEEEWTLLLSANDIHPLAPGYAGIYATIKHTEIHTTTEPL